MILRNQWHGRTEKGRKRVNESQRDRARNQKRDMVEMAMVSNAQEGLDGRPDSGGTLTTFEVEKVKKLQRES